MEERINDGREASGEQGDHGGGNRQAEDDDQEGGEAPGDQRPRGEPVRVCARPVVPTGTPGMITTNATRSLSNRPVWSHTLSHGNGGAVSLGHAYETGVAATVTGLR